MSTGQRRLAAVVVTDVAGYSRLVSIDEEGTLATMQAYRQEIIEPKLTQYHGRVANTAGDSMLIEFPSAVDALRCGIEIQREIERRSEGVPEERRILFRMGINVGDVIAQGSDLLGDGVNIAARLESLASSGGICISGSVHDHVAGKLDIEPTDLGELNLKNIERPVRVYALTNIVKAGDGTQRPINVSNDSASHELSQFDRPSVVVMPFENLGGGDQDSLADGLRLSLHSVLVKLSGLFLLHTGTVERYRGQTISAINVGRDINVRYVVEGAVQRSGDRVRFNLQVTDALTGQLILAERYDRILDDIFDLEDEIAQEVVGALDIGLRSGEAGRAWWQGITDPAARAYIHQGLSHLYKGTEADNGAARRILEQLDELQPDWPQCLGLIALTHWRDARFGWATDADASLKKAGDFAERATELGDPDGLALAVIGSVRLYQRRHQEALDLCSQALAKRPSCPTANGLLAEVMQYSGEPDKSVTLIKNAIRHVQLFPPWMIHILASSYRDGQNFTSSISAANEAVRMFPDALDGRIILSSSYYLADLPDRAKEMARHIIQVDPSFSIEQFAKTQPYKDEETLGRIIDGLKRAGLPD